MDHHVKSGSRLVTGYVLEDSPDPPAVPGCFSSAAGAIISSAAAAIRPLTDCGSTTTNRHRPLPLASVQGNVSSHKSKIPSVGTSLVSNTSKSASQPLKSASTVGGTSDQLKKCNDPAWAYGIIKLEHPNYVFCKLCSKKLMGVLFFLVEATPCGIKVDEKRRKKGKLSENTSDENYKEKLQDKATNQVAQWTYAVRISFNAVRYGSFNKIFEYIGPVGSDMKPPAYQGVGVNFLEKYHEVENFVKNFKVHYETHGCSVMCNEWTDGKHLALNFLVNCSKGTIFLKSVDVSKHAKSDTMLAKMIEDVILEHVGVSNVVQVITDNTSNYKAIGDILMNKYPSLCWGACTVHWVDLILEDIGKLPIFSRVVKDSQRLISFIYSNTHMLDLMRYFTQSKELLRPVVTRFATFFLCLKSIHSNKDVLRSMFVSDEWDRMDWSTKTEGKQIASIVAGVDFWSDILHCLKVLSPLLEVAKLVHADEKHTMGYIYHAMRKAKALIKKNFHNESRLSMEYWKIVNARWDDQFHQDLYATGYYLNPYLYFERGVLQMEADGQIKQRLFDVITKMCADPIKEDVIHKQLVTYREAKGMMGLPVAIRRRSTTAPAEWWMTYGSDVKELQSFALRVLSQTINATPCERNWRVFENIHTKKRSNLAQKKLNDIIYIQYNERLRNRFENHLNLDEKEMDPILLHKIDDCKEWIVPTEDELVFEGEMASCRRGYGA